LYARIWSFYTSVLLSWFENKRKDWNLKFKLNQVYIPSHYYRYMVRALVRHCSCYSVTRGVTIVVHNNYRRRHIFGFSD
jgi:hypothetical protein